MENINPKLVGDIPDWLIDLIEIASYVYCADQAVRRGGTQQRAMGTDWRRDFRFVIPVRDPRHWSNPRISKPLCAALEFLSDDYYSFEFEKVADPAPLQSYMFGGDAGTAFKADGVILFSDGLDSLSGVVEELATPSKRLALVSHRSSTPNNQKRLVTALEKRYPGRLIHLPVLIESHHDTPALEHTHLTRSFLYASLAYLVACLLGTDETLFFNNGVRSINLPIADKFVGTRATRTTHPFSLRNLCDFFNAAAGKPIKIENPFIWKIKPDVIRSIIERGCSDLIKDTVSCTRPREMRKEHSHCGCCSECFDRRFGVLAAGAAEYDPVEKYKVELLAGDRDTCEDKTMAESYVSTALELLDISERAFFSRFVGLTSRVCHAFPSMPPDEISGIHCTCIIVMLRQSRTFSWPR
jgi:hypothetical protein